MSKGLGTWAPLVGTAALVVVVVLRLIGHGEAAAAVEKVAGMLGLTQAPGVIPLRELAETGAAFVGALGAGWGVVRKLRALLRPGAGGSAPRVLRGAGLVLVAAVLVPLTGCTDPGPTSPENVVVTINNNQNQNTGSGNQSPIGNGAGQCEAVRYVELSFTLGGQEATSIPPGGSGTVSVRALSASRAPITEGRCLPAPTWAKTGPCDLAGDAGAYSRALTARPNGSGTCGLDVTISEAQGNLALPIR